MVKAFFQFFLLPLFLTVPFAAGGAVEAGDTLAERVVIVVNERDDGSAEVGEHYAKRRGIPRENIISIDSPTRETIDRKDFIESIYNPLRRQLLEKGWLAGMPSDEKDPEGRDQSVIRGHRIAYLVVCRGVPLRIRNDAEQITPQMERQIQKEFLTTSASVDSELALLTGLAPAVGFVPNPLFREKTPGEQKLASVIKVARLDGPTVVDAKQLVDNAIEGERRGLRGRAYVDLAGPHPTGKQWLEATADRIRALGFDLDLHEGKGVFPISARFDAPALYFGWYAQDVSGPFLLDGFRFPPGAIASHIHSFSATTLRDPSSGWVGPLVSRGVTATFGNVYEPYLELSHRPDLFLEWIADGGNVGDAAAYAIRGLSWQGIVVGDPLYRPFARSFDELVAEGEEEGSALDVYTILRRMNQLAADGDEKEAMKHGLAALEREPNLALALSVAKMQVEARERRAAIRTLSAVAGVKPSSLMETMLAKEAADLLSTLNEHGSALEIYQALLDKSDLPADARKALLKDGVLLASRLGRQTLTEDWRGELSEL